jgi:hypothetical protein
VHRTVFEKVVAPQLWAWALLSEFSLSMQLVVVVALKQRLFWQNLPTGQTPQSTRLATPQLSVAVMLLQ